MRDHYTPGTRRGPERELYLRAIREAFLIRLYLSSNRMRLHVQLGDSGPGRGSSNASTTAWRQGCPWLRRRTATNQGEVGADEVRKVVVSIIRRDGDLKIDPFCCYHQTKVSAGISSLGTRNRTPNSKEPNDKKKCYHLT